MKARKMNQRFAHEQRFQGPGGLWGSLAELVHTFLMRVLSLTGFRPHGVKSGGCLMLVALAGLFLPGCAAPAPRSAPAYSESSPKPPSTVPAAAEPASPASNAPAAGNDLAGSAFPFREVVVSVPVEGAGQVYQNLHVHLVATVQAKAGAAYSATSVLAMVKRLEPRVCGSVVKVLTDSPTLSPHKLDQVRENLIAKMQPAIRQTLGEWAGSDAYDVDVVIVSLYWTDTSGGRREP